MEEHSKQIIVYGTTWCSDCNRSKQFLRKHRIRFEWVDIEQDPQAMAYVERMNQGSHIVPTIVFPDGSVLAEPSNGELAQKLGLIGKPEHTL